MKVLLLGGGGREHALAWKISQSPRLTRLFCAPGNPGTARFGTNVPISAEDPAAVLALARRELVDLVVVGPEAPLVNGVADALTGAGFAVFGPSAAAAQIEGSKAFAKDVMRRAGVPTARFEVFDDPGLAEAHAAAGGAVVVKVDGLAAGKGVVVAKTAAEAVAAVRTFSGGPGPAPRLLLEEVLDGPEASVIGLVDGERFALFPAARDHKRLLDGDGGPNTGGMGAFCPLPELDEAALAQIGRTVFAPVLAELNRRGTPFRGALFAGLMLTRSGPMVLEFNCRFGDPETQVLMLQLDGDLLPLLDQCAYGGLSVSKLPLRGGHSVGVVLAAPGYPGTVQLGGSITGIDAADGRDAQVFHAGVKQGDVGLTVAGGRVLTVCARGDSLEEARARAYAAAELIQFEGKQLRRDIGAGA